MSSYRSYRKKVKDSSTVVQAQVIATNPYGLLTNSFLGDDAQCKKTTNTDTSSSVINEEEESLNTTVDDSQCTSATAGDGQTDSSARPPTVRRRNNPIELVAAGETVKDALDTLKETLRKRQVHEDDECDLHGKVIAKKLRKLPEEERMQFVCEIYNMFLQHEKRLASFSPISLASPSPSPTYERAQTSQSCYSEPTNNALPLVTNQS